MGKTYVALGAVALFRHFNPDFRLLVIAPRENIQRKWMKELRNFVRNNVRFPDLASRPCTGHLPGAPWRATIWSSWSARLASIRTATSLRASRASVCPWGRTPASWRKRRDELLEHVPWLDEDVFRSSTARRTAGVQGRLRPGCLRSAACVRPRHRGRGTQPQARLQRISVGPQPRPGPGLRASRSATDSRLSRTTGLGQATCSSFRPRRWRTTTRSSGTNSTSSVWGTRRPRFAPTGRRTTQKRACAQDFLIRRVTSLPVGGDRLTKNQYRREWRAGGVTTHDQPLRCLPTDRDRQRLIVALVQKKVSEVLGHERFNNSFQIGMLASFESFLETAKVKRDDRG